MSACRTRRGMCARFATTLANPQRLLVAAGLLASAALAAEPAPVRADAAAAGPVKSLRARARATPARAPIAVPATLAPKAAPAPVLAAPAKDAAMPPRAPGWTQLGLVLTRPLRTVLGLVSQDAWMVATPFGLTDATAPRAIARHVESAAEQAPSLDWMLQLRAWQDPTRAPLGDRPRLAQAPQSALLRDLFVGRDQVAFGRPLPQLNVGLNLRF